MRFAARLELLLVLTAAGALPACGGPSAAPRPAAPEVAERIVTADATVARLSNGLTVIVKATRTAPVVCVKGYVRAGGLYEKEWLGCGLSHLLEHLVAKEASHEGAKTAEGTVDRVTRIGGQSNAYTTRDHTCYYISASAGKTDDCIDLIADWLVRPDITEADFRREHGVVQRELEKGKDEPDQVFAQAYMENLYGAHPAAVPVIGRAEPLGQVAFADVLAYHRRMYVPQNMVFVVVGDVDVEKVLARTTASFAGLAEGRQPDLSLPEVQPLAGVRRVERASKDLQETMEAVSFQSIPLLDDDLYALDVLAYVAANGPSSRLYREVYRNRKLVTSISCDSWTPAWGKGALTIDFRCDPDKADAAERAILEELKKIVDRGVTVGELDRAKRQKVADWVYSQQTAESVAGTLAGDLLSTGDVLFSQHYAERIQGVTPEQVQAAARKYLSFDKMAVTRMAPKMAAATAAQPQTARQFERQVFTLPNGLTVILQPADAGLVTLAYVVKGGLLSETEKTNGLGALMASLSTRGTKNYTAKQIDEFFDRAGGGLSGSSGNNSCFWQATVLEDSFDKALDIFADVIVRPTFPKEELEILRPKALAAIKAQEEEWFGQLYKYFRATFFAGVPYGMLPLGREDVVKSATVEAVREYYQRNIATPERLSEGGDARRLRPGVLAIYGKFDAAGLRPRLEKLFDFPKAAEGRKTDYRALAVRPPKSDETHVMKTDRKQAAIMIGAPGTTTTDLKDRAALDVLDTIISGYRLPAGWLHTELREKQLVYVVHADHWPGLAQGTFFAYAACQPEKAKVVLDILLKDFRKASKYKPTQARINEAVNVILTAELLDKQDLPGLALDAALNELYGLGHDFNRKQEKLYRAVTGDDVLRVGRKYLGGGYVITATTPRPELLK